MKNEVIFDAVINSIPQWYYSETGPYKYTLRLGESSKTFYSLTPLSPKLEILYEYANEMLPKWWRMVKGSSLPIYIEFIQSFLALKWISLFNSSISSSELSMFLRNCTFRSYENNSIKINLIISEGTGSINITNPEFHKLLDPLASSNQVFMRIDCNLNFLTYEEIPWSAIKETENYKFNPEFLQPYASVIQEGEISVHLTEKNDIIIMNHDGVIASKRKGYWYFYDVHNFTESAINIIGDQRACMLLETLLDLSYNRKGALIVHDPDHKVIKQVVNKNSILTEEYGTPDTFRKMLLPFFRPVPRYHPSIIIPIRRKRLILELTELDGALILDNNRILSFGSMIKPHPGVSNHKGARSTAAESAYKWGGTSFNVSSDGEIKIYFDSYGPTSTAPAQLRMM
jgi:hypothetical protein